MTDNCTYLDRDTSFSGEICTGDIIIEGEVSGEVEASDSVLIRRGAVIDGPIRTGRFLLEEGGKHTGRVQFGSQAESSRITSFLSRLFGSGRKQNGRAAHSRTVSADDPDDQAEALSEKNDPKAEAPKEAPETEKAPTPRSDSWSEQLW